MKAYKIKDLEVLTGIKAHTIRTWEKRYGILKPERTYTQIRKYDDVELTLLLNISLLNKNGIKISHIAEMSIKEISSLVKSENNKIANPFHGNLLLSLIQLDEALFCSTINKLVEEISFELTFIDHLIPFLEKIGIMWLCGTINPAQEHFISNLIRQKIITEIDKLPLENNGKKVILFLPEHENHEVSLLFYTYVLRKNKMQTFYLGNHLPYDALIESIKQIKPHYIVSSWISNVDAIFLKSYFKNLINDKSFKIFAGGYQFNALEDEIKKSIHIISSLEDLKLIYME